jgi:hypothetical protein
VAKAEKFTEEQLRAIRADLPDMRSRFFEALEDPDHWVWRYFYFGVPGRPSDLSFTGTSKLHPLGHRCQSCDKWRAAKANAPLAEIEAQVLARRARREPPPEALTG